MIAYINTSGCLKSAVSKFPEVFKDVEHFQRYLNGDLKFSPEESFTTTYFASPPLAIEEVEKADFNIVSYAGAESFLSGLNIQMKNLYVYILQVYENFMNATVESCELPLYGDVIEHLHIIVKK